MMDADNYCGDCGEDVVECVCKLPDTYAGYPRPRTRGELARLLKQGIPCEVSSDVAEITVVMITGWLGSKNVVVRPSENAGWSIFEGW